MINKFMNVNRALGISFYQMCTGQLPFHANGTEAGGKWICHEKEPELPFEYDEFKPLYHK